MWGRGAVQISCSVFVLDVTESASVCVCVANVTKAAFHLLFGGVSGPGIHYPVPAWIRKEKRTW